MNHVTKFLLITIVLCFSSRSILRAEESQPSLSLTSAVTVALHNYAAIQQAEENLVSAEFGKHSARADMLPKLSANYGLTAFEDAPYMVQGDRHVQIAHSSQHLWDITISQPLFTGFALSTNYQISQLNVNIKIKEQEKTRLDVIYGVKKAYYDLLLANKTLGVADDTVNYLKSHEQDTLRFFESGITRRNDLLRAQVALADAVQGQEIANARVDIITSILNRWLGYEIHQPINIQEIKTVPKNKYALENLLKVGLQNRPIMQVLHLSQQVLGKAVTLEKSAYYPEVALIGSYQQNGDTLAADRNAYSNDHNTFIGVRATWDIFNWSKRKSSVAKAKADKRAFEQHIRIVQDGVLVEIKDAYLSHHVALKNIITSKASVTSAKENLRITTLGYRQQTVTSTEILDARADLTQAQSNFHQALYGYLHSQAALERSVGVAVIDSDGNMETRNTVLKEVGSH